MNNFRGGFGENVYIPFAANCVPDTTFKGFIYMHLIKVHRATLVHFAYSNKTATANKSQTCHSVWSDIIPSDKLCLQFATSTTFPVGTVCKIEVK